MSGLNVETVQRTVERFRTGAVMFAAGDWEPDADYYPIKKFPEARPRHGARDIEDFFTGFADGWEAFDFATVAIVAIGEDKVFVHSKLTVRDAGMELESDLFQCVWLRHGRILRWEDHLTEEGAVHALGLGGQTIEAALS